MSSHHTPSSAFSSAFNSLSSSFCPCSVPPQPRRRQRLNSRRIKAQVHLGFPLVPEQSRLKLQDLLQTFHQIYVGVLKGMHENCVMLYSRACHSKPTWPSWPSFCCWTQKRMFRGDVHATVCCIMKVNGFYCQASTYTNKAKTNTFIVWKTVAWTLPEKKEKLRVTWALTKDKMSKFSILSEQTFLV